MKNSPVDCRSPLGLFPGEPAARLSDRIVEVMRTQHRRFLVMPSEKGFMQVSLNKSHTVPRAELSWRDNAYKSRPL